MGPISGGEFIVLLVLAAIVLGPERLPQYAQQLARLIRELRRMAQGASAQVRQEMGAEFDDIDWSKLDPRQYDPRKIVRDALAEDGWDEKDPLGMKSLREDVDTLLRDDLDPAKGPTDAPRRSTSAERDREDDAARVSDDIT